MSANAKSRETEIYVRGANGALYVIPADGMPARRIDDDHGELRSGATCPQRGRSIDARPSTMTIVPDDGDASAMSIVPYDAAAAAMSIVPDDAA